MMTLTTLAQASSMQESCSNAKGTVRFELGHYENYIEVTKWSSSDDEGTKYEKIRKDLHDGEWKLEELSSQIISNEQNSQCREGEDIGFAWARKVDVRKVRITKSDGSLFEDGILGLTSDRKAVEATLLCEWEVSNIMPCEK